MVVERKESGDEVMERFCNTKTPDDFRLGFGFKSSDYLRGQFLRNAFCKKELEQ